MERRLRAAAVFLCLAVSFGYSVQRALEWIKRSRDPKAPIEAFAEEARATIPPKARVLVVVPGGPRWNRDANLLSARLHPRLLVAEGPADWIIELPAGDFDRSRASIRKANP